jgi:hypothetical protein
MARMSCHDIALTPPPAAAAAAACQRVCRRRSIEEADSGEPVDAAAMARMVALVAQRGGELDTALEQVGQFENAPFKQALAAQWGSPAHVCTTRQLTPPNNAPLQQAPFSLEDLLQLKQACQRTSVHYPRSICQVIRC